MLTLAASLPLVIAMVKRPALYNGIRHFVFVIPPMAVLAGVIVRLGHELAQGSITAAGNPPRWRCSRSACCCRSAR